MPTDPIPYYVVRAGTDRFDLRQARFRGTEHPHDLMAVGFTAAGMREVIAKYFAGKVDTSALPPLFDPPADSSSAPQKELHNGTPD